MITKAVTPNGVNAAAQYESSLTCKEAKSGYRANQRHRAAVGSVASTAARRRRLSVQPVRGAPPLAEW
jgi:hypothetical protein